MLYAADMALPFLKSTSKKKRDQMLSIDLGGRNTKAVFLQRKGNGLALSNYVLLDAPIYERDPSVDLLTEHFQAVAQTLDVKTKLVALALGVNESIVRHVEMPQMPPDDIRLVLKNNARMYLQQDLPDYVFDVSVMSRPREAAGGKQAASQKNKILVAGAKRELMSNLQAAAKNVGWVMDHIIPGLIAPVSAFEMAMPQEFAGEVVGLVDIGFKNSTICLLRGGELIMSRVVAIGGDKLTSGLAEAMNISYAEAEGIKIGMPTEVESNLEPLIIPLGRELRASVDFFEHQEERTVGQVYVCGGASRSEFILQILKQELMMDCRTWNPATSLQLDLPSQKAAELEQVASQLTVAVGTALTAL